MSAVSTTLPSRRPRCSPIATTATSSWLRSRSAATATAGFPCGGNCPYSALTISAVQVSGVSFDRAAHAPGAAAAATKLAAGDGDHFDAMVAQVGICGDIPLVGHDHARLDREDVAAVVPLFARRRMHVLNSGEHGDL